VRSARFDAIDNEPLGGQISNVFTLRDGRITASTTTGTDPNPGRRRSFPSRLALTPTDGRRAVGGPPDQDEERCRIGPEVLARISIHFNT